MVPYLYTVYAIKKETSDRESLGLYTAEEVTHHFGEADGMFEIVPYISSIQGSYYI